MFKIYSKGCQYALRLLTQIPINGVHRKFLAVDLCRKAKVPVHSARKTLQLLVKHQFLSAVPGPGGGYILKKRPDQITLLDIIQLIDGEKAFEKCVMGLNQCDSKNPCPAHDLWLKVKNGMKKEMRGKTLMELMRVVKGRII